MIEITTVKEQRDVDTNELTSYLVNGSMSVPLAEGNRHYQMVKDWITAGNTPDAAFSQAELGAHAYEQAKQQRQTNVNNITVTVDTMVFDGDEISQTRMARAVASSSVGETTQWKLADNSVATVTHEQLKQALRLAGEAQTTLWMA